MNADYADLFTRVGAVPAGCGPDRSGGPAARRARAAGHRAHAPPGDPGSGIPPRSDVLGFTVPAIDSGSTLFRWGVLFALAGSALFGWRNPGLPAMMVAALGLFGAATAGFSPRPQYGFQFGVGLILMTGLAGGVIARNFPGVGRRAQAHRLLQGRGGRLRDPCRFGVADAAAGRRFSGLLSSAPAVRDDRRHPPSHPAVVLAGSLRGPRSTVEERSAGPGHPGAHAPFRPTSGSLRRCDRKPAAHHQRPGRSRGSRASLGC